MSSQDKSAQQDQLHLFTHPQSGHVKKVQMFLQLAELEYIEQEIDIFAPPAQRPAFFNENSPFGEVPVLIVNEQAICQSNAILMFLADRYGRLDGNTKQERAHVREWLFWEASRLSASLPSYRYFLKFAPETEQEIVQLFRQRSLAALARLESQLKTQDFVVSCGITIADLSCSGYLFWLHEANIDVKDYPSIQAWLGRIEERLEAATA